EGVEDGTAVTINVVVDVGTDRCNRLARHHLGCALEAVRQVALPQRVDEAVGVARDRHTAHTEVLGIVAGRIDPVDVGRGRRRVRVHDVDTAGRARTVHRVALGDVWHGLPGEHVLGRRVA